MLNSSLSPLFPLISKVLVALKDGEVDQFPKRKKIDDLVQVSGAGKDVVLSILSILAILGFVEIGDDEDVIISSKYPHLAISALKERLDLSFPVLHNLRDEEKKRYFREFTKSLEMIRSESQGAEIPIHNRTMINIIIKGRQIKNWKHQDVFLHIFHPGWNEYHLIGIGMRGENSTDELVHKAMKKRLHLEPIDYEIDNNINPPAIEYISISKSQGALTFYTIETRVVSKLKLDLNEHLKKEIQMGGDFTSKTFKWFSLEEIQQRNVRGASIMESTPRVLEELTGLPIPVVVKRAQRYEAESIFDIKVFSDIPNRLDLGKAIFYFFAILITLLIALFIINISTLFNVQLPWLDNADHIASIVGAAVGVVLFLKGIREST
ncbi:MAG: hypothetical protein HY865_07550 [Chloroflexi bacterium]|nr:hypothetical protein [Chloroflexota bacterium]